MTTGRTNDDLNSFLAPLRRRFACRRSAGGRAVLGRGHRSEGEEATPGSSAVDGHSSRHLSLRHRQRRELGPTHHLGYDAALGTFTRRLPLTFLSNVAGLTQDPAWVYIPKGTKSLDLEVWDK